MQSKATTVAQYLREIPTDRRVAIEAIRKVIVDNIDDGIAEGMQYGMICFSVPHSVFPQGYHCDPKQPLPYAAIASQKQYMSVYVVSPYMGAGRDEAWVRAEYARKGRKLDMGKSCIRFKRLEDFDLDVLAELIRSSPSKEFVAKYVATVGPDAWKSTKRAAAKPVAKAVAKPVAKAVAKPVAKAVAKAAPATKKAAAKKAAASSTRAPAKKK